MTLDEAIKHAEEVAERERANAELIHEMMFPPGEVRAMQDDCLKCAKDHRQLAVWLKELQEYKELFDSPKEAREILNMDMV